MNEFPEHDRKYKKEKSLDANLSDLMSLKKWHFTRIAREGGHHEKPVELRTFPTFSQLTGRIAQKIEPTVKSSIVQNR